MSCETYTLFIGEYNDTKLGWVEDKRYYKGDLSYVDVKTDNRFKDIDGRRKNFKFVEVKCVTFPIACF